MKFKNAQIEVEFWSAHPLVRALACYAEAWLVRMHSHEPTITDVGRTQAEYDSIYADKIHEGMFFVSEDGTKHYAGPRPHLADEKMGVKSHAVDFRTHDPATGQPVLSEGVWERFADHMNASFPRRDKKPTVLIHDVGRGKHAHLQAAV